MGGERREAGGAGCESGGASREAAGARFEVRRRVLFSETDVAGIVHFSNFFRYFEDAEHALWRQAGLCIHETKSPIAWPRVSASCDYHRALKFDEEFDVSVAIAEITKRTIRYEGAIRRNGERIASGSWKIACVNRLADGTMKSTDMPTDVAERLKRLAARNSNLAPRASRLVPRTSDV